MAEQHLSGKSPEQENERMYAFHVVLFSDADEMYDLWLPSTTEGFFRFSTSPEHRFLSIFSCEQRWIVHCKKPAYFFDSPFREESEIKLQPDQLIKISCDDRIYILYVEEVTPELLKFRSYATPSDCRLLIGSQFGCDIQYRNAFVSDQHAILVRSNSRWSVRDIESEYGIYINGERQEYKDLRLGDVLYIMGMRIIIGLNFIAVNDADKRIVLKSQSFSGGVKGQASYSYYPENQLLDASGSTFNRPPRKLIGFSPQTITIEGPPMSMARTQMPLMLRMGSSIVMGGSAALAGNYTMLLTSLLFPFLSSKYTENEKQAYEKLRIEKYTEYLQKKEHELHTLCRTEQYIANQKYPALESVALQIRKKTRLWERRPTDDDFLHVRLGTGETDFSAEIDYPKKRFELDTDALEERMYQLAEHRYRLENMPIVLSFFETNVCGIQGCRAQILEYIFRIVYQLVVFHSYDEVKLVFLIRPSELEEMEYIRYLPHVWDNHRSIRFIATSEEEVYRLGEYIKEQIDHSEEEQQDIYKILKKRPYYLIFSLDRRLLDSHDFFKDLLCTENNIGASIIAAHDDLPKETKKTIDLRKAGEYFCTTLAKNGSINVRFTLDDYDKCNVLESFRILSNTTLKAVVQSHSIPKLLTFLEMFQVGRIEQLNPLRRWKENNPVISLSAPVGIGADGASSVLDLHEKCHGPHGLVAGMTGSGKSEFIITYILSMAINYHPDEVSFLLIDYKGGGLAGAFENTQTGIKLPHLVGTITNLDGSSIQRSLMSIESELLRRQKIFNEVRSIVNEGTMDIYTYQKLYRSGKVSEPVPHLFIISDEFAELKQQQPEFMSKLISAARIGRSLGVHLILATQKPSGVVDEQIRSNTKFRVCLRVQDRSDSMDMLRRPEAAELVDTGRFYLQVGYNEYFALGQSAWCGADYEPQDTVIVQKDETIEFLDTTGQITIKVKPKTRKISSGKKQIVAIVEYLSDIAKIHKIKTRQLCQPELPKTIDLESLQARYPSTPPSMSICLGMMDDPENQLQIPMCINFESCGNLLIVGNSGGGKTVILQNILYSLAWALSPKDFNFYVLDYSSRMLKLFKPLPHCGAVLQEEDIDRLDEFFKLINKLVAERKKLFSQLEVDSFEEARKLTPIPLVLVMIDNLSGLSSSKAGETHMYNFQSYLKNSSVYGIKYIVTCSHLNEVSSRIRQELEDRICLYMRDKYDYSEILGCKVNYYPPEIPGRGLYKFEDRPLELHNAMICANTEERQRVQFIKSEVLSICKSFDGLTEVRHLATSDTNADYADFAAQFKHGRIPLGIAKPTDKPVALPLKQFDVLSVYFGNLQGKRPLISNFLYSAQQENMDIWIVKQRQKSLFDPQTRDCIHIDDIKNADSLSGSVSDLRLLQQALLGIVAQRKALIEDFCAKNNVDMAENSTIYELPGLKASTAPILLILENVVDFCEKLSPIAILSYCKLFEQIHRYGIHVLGCFEPCTISDVSNNALFSLFSSHAFILLGGQLDKQMLYRFGNVPGIDKTLPYNVGRMSYRKQMYSLVIPCGKIEQIEIDEDLESIF